MFLPACHQGCVCTILRKVAEGKKEKFQVNLTTLRVCAWENLLKQISVHHSKLQ